MTAALPPDSPSMGSMLPKAEIDKKTAAPTSQPATPPAASSTPTEASAKIQNVFKSLEATTKAAESLQKHTITLATQKDNKAGMATTGLVAKGAPTGGLTLEERRVALVDKHFNPKGELETDKSLVLFKVLSDQVRQYGEYLADQSEKAAGSLVAHDIDVVKTPTQMYINKEGHVFVHLKSPLGDDKGSFKDVSTALKYDSAELVVVAMAKAQNESAFENIQKEGTHLKSFAGKEGIAQMHDIIYVPDPKDQTKSVAGGLMLVFYENGDLESRIKQDRPKRESDEDGFDMSDTKKAAAEPLTLGDPKEYAVKVSDAVTLLRGLKTTHEAGIVHNDIKPGNIYRGKGTIVLADYGEASKPGADCKGGTTTYMSPEALSPFSRAARIFMGMAPESRAATAAEDTLKEAQTKLSEDPKSTDAQKAVAEAENKLKAAKATLDEAIKKLEEDQAKLSYPKDVWAMGVVLYEYFFPLADPPIFVSTPGQDMWHEKAMGNLAITANTPEPEKSIKETIKAMLTREPDKRMSSADALAAFEKIKAMTTK